MENQWKGIAFLTVNSGLKVFQFKKSKAANSVGAQAKLVSVIGNLVALYWAQGLNP